MNGLARFAGLKGRIATILAASCDGRADRICSRDSWIAEFAEPANSVVVLRHLAQQRLACPKRHDPALA